MGLRDLLDRLNGQPGWHREHEQAWLGLTTVGPDRLSPLQKRLQARVAELLSSTEYSMTPWQFASQSHITCTADIRELGLRIWLDPDTASFGRTVKKGELVPDRVFEEWDYKLPEHFIDHFARELQVALRQGAA